MEHQVSKLCGVCYFHLRRLRTVCRSLSKECLRTLVHAFVTSRVDHCNGLLYGYYSYFLDGLQSVLNSATRLVLNIAKFSGIWLPSVTSYTGYQSESASSSKLFFWCDIAWSALHLSTWWNCVVLSVQPPVDKASGLLPEATSSFLVSDSEHLVSELLLSRSGPQLWNSLPLDVRQSRDNLMQFKKKLKNFCSSSSERFCGSKSNEGPYKCSILLLLIKVLHCFSCVF